ncbi:DegT/DnrJ/EryC1/StrS family aminotransferase [Caulobacter sp. FWC2]|uniref:DegT/DnrJ/EryC1/StrS family aminotransferase n=1 Tax=Caulobacter sp. FWC2 TaxID=69664 RepID=UPI0011783102|nr:DegT/DnrJ/EryC1/StrS family aminotransferase [Caulobacter sp. FWC2]
MARAKRDWQAFAVSDPSHRYLRRPSRDRLVAKLEADEIESAHVVQQIHRMPHHAHLNTVELSLAKAVATDGLNLPVHVDLTGADIDRVAATLAEALAQK